MTYLNLYVQCTASNGETGTFLAKNGKEPFSPVFDNMGDLHSWATSQGLLEPFQSLTRIPENATF